MGNNNCVSRGDHIFKHVALQKMGHNYVVRYKKCEKCHEMRIEHWVNGKLKRVDKVYVQ